MGPRTNAPVLIFYPCPHELEEGLKIIHNTENKKFMEKQKLYLLADIMQEDSQLYCPRTLDKKKEFITSTPSEML